MAGHVRPGGTCEKDGVKAEFTLIARSSSREDQNAANRIRAWANELGIKINLSIITDDALNSQIYNPTSSTKKADADKYEPTYDAFIWGWFGDLGTPDYDFEILTCGSFSTDSYYCNPKFDKLSQEALAETDFDRRVELLHQAEKIALEESPYVFLTFQNSPYVTRNDTWTNYQPTPKVDGNPFSISWSQLQFLEPGKKASTSYAGAPAALIVLLVGIAAVFAYAWLRRWREARQPLEVSEQSEGKP